MRLYFSFSIVVFLFSLSFLKILLCFCVWVEMGIMGRCEFGNGFMQMKFDLVIMQNKKMQVPKNISYSFNLEMYGP